MVDNWEFMYLPTFVSVKMDGIIERLACVACDSKVFQLFILACDTA
jgi:hypothetical protein